MKQGKTLQELAAELERQQSAKADYIADTRELTMLSSHENDTPGGSELSIKGNGEFEISDHAHLQIANRLKIPKIYYDRLRESHAGLLDHNVNTLFRENPEKRMVRTLDGNARAFLSDRYRRLDNYDLAQAVLPVLAELPDAEIKSCELTDSRMYIKVVLPKIEREVAKGDVVQSGLLISNSEVGQGSLQVAPLVYRLICLNGMVASDYGTKRYHVGRRIGEDETAYQVFSDETMKADDKALFLKVQDTVKACANEVLFDQIVDSLKELRELRIGGDPIQAVEKLSSAYRLSDDEQGSVLRHLVENGDLSAWGAVNAITRAAQDVESYDRSTQLERIGGEVAELPHNELASLLAAA